jgi:hypothetical protein
VLFIFSWKTHRSIQDLGEEQQELIRLRHLICPFLGCRIELHLPHSMHVVYSRTISVLPFCFEYNFSFVVSLAKGFLNLMLIVNMTMPVFLVLGIVVR